MKKLLYYPLLMALILLGSCSKPIQVLKIGIIKPSIDHFPLSYALHKGWLEHTKYQCIPFTSGWETQEALIAGRIDAAILPFTYVWNAAAKNYPVKTVSFFERETDAVIASPEITSNLALNNAKVGVLKASTLDMLWRDYAQKEQINAEVIYFRTPNEIVAALQSRQIAAAVLYVPIINKLSSQYRIIHWFSERYAAHPCCDLAVNTAQLNSAKTALMKNLYSVLEDTSTKIDTTDSEVREYLLSSYGLSDSQLSEALQHTIFKMGLEPSGKEFQRQIAQLSLGMGYIDRIPADWEVYLNLDAK